MPIILNYVQTSFWQLRTKNKLRRMRLLRQKRRHLKNALFLMQRMYYLLSLLKVEKTNRRLWVHVSIFWNTLWIIFNFDNYMYDFRPDHNVFGKLMCPQWLKTDLDKILEWTEVLSPFCATNCLLCWQRRILFSGKQSHCRKELQLASTLWVHQQNIDPLRIFLVWVALQFAIFSLISAMQYGSRWSRSIWIFSNLSRHKNFKSVLTVLPYLDFLSAVEQLVRFNWNQSETF